MDRKEYSKISPMGKIPAMQEINETTGEIFNLVESHTIMRYLADSREVEDHWYTRDNPQKRALVDMYLDQHHSMLRYGMFSEIQALLFHFMLGQPVDYDKIKRG